MVERNPRSRAGGVHCPRCEQVELDERERDGILIDVCRSCRGVWLDRGELEKLIARATREVHEPFGSQLLQGKVSLQATAPKRVWPSSAVAKSSR